MKKFLYFSLIIVAVFLGLIFTYWNNQLVTLEFPYAKFEVYLPALLIAVFALGLIIGYLLCFVSSIKVRRKLSATKKELKRQESSF